jgi:uncharacterized membrane protein YedE/YeeE
VNKDNGGWNPYLAGVLSGIVIIASAFMGLKFFGQPNYFGASTCFVRTTGFLASIFDPDRVSGMEYFVRFIPKVDWQVMMVGGILIGAFISSITEGSFKIQAIPDMWEKQFGSSRLKRNLTAFAGGVILMFGARLAGGCPSGYGLGALVQLAVSGLVVVMCFFIGGIVVAQIMYHGGDAK